MTYGHENVELESSFRNAVLEVTAMRLHRVRITVGRIMIAMAVVAVAMFLVIKPLWVRAHWSRIAEHQRRQADAYLGRLTALDQSDRDDHEKLLVRFKWHQSMAARYARAAAYPGMPEPKDSPPP